MTDHAVIQGTYSKWEHLPTRKIVRVSIDIPEEADRHAFEVLGGMPNHGEQRWVVLARLTPEAIQRAPSAPESPLQTTLDDATAEYNSWPKWKWDAYQAEVERGRPSAPQGASEDPVSKLWPEHMQKPKRAWGDLPRSQRAALLCKDEEFREWFTEFGGAYENEAEFDEGFKRHFGITSKRQLDHEGPEAQSFERLEREWLAFKHGEPPVTAYAEEVR